jgi:Ca2+-binding EF-hand superfamily protein
VSVFDLLVGEQGRCVPIEERVAVATGEKADLRDVVHDLCEEYGISALAEAFLQRALDANPQTRATADELLKDPFVALGIAKEDKAAVKKSVAALKEFGCASAVKRLFLSAAASGLHSFDLVKLREAFESFDPQRKGEVSLEDMRTVLAKELEEDEVEDTLDALDSDGSGMVSYAEFIAAAMGAEAAARREVCAAVFQTFDINEDGFVSRVEFAEVLKHQDIAKMADVDAILKNMKLANPDEVTFDEFCEMMQKV